MASITEITQVRIADIRPYENNAKIHGREQLEKLKASIQKYFPRGGKNDTARAGE